jgi:hypothetical protein
VKELRRALACDLPRRRPRSCGDDEDQDAIAAFDADGWADPGPTRYSQIQCARVHAPRGLARIPGPAVDNVISPARVT